jgi:hypothetical protein
MKNLLLPALFCLYLPAQSQNVGIGVVSPTDKLHINTAAGEDALRIQVNSSTRLRVWNNGGTSIGSLNTPPMNGLFVSGSIQPQNGITTPSRMVIESTADSILIKAGGSEVIIAANGNIIIRSGGSSNISFEAGGSLNFSAASQISFSAGANININSSNIMSLAGTQIRLNGNSKPIARQGDAVSGGVIVTGSPTVFTN